MGWSQSEASKITFLPFCDCGQHSLSAAESYDKFKCFDGFFYCKLMLKCLMHHVFALVNFNSICQVIPAISSTFSSGRCTAMVILTAGHFLLCGMGSLVDHKTTIWSEKQNDTWSLYPSYQHYEYLIMSLWKTVSSKFKVFPALLCSLAILSILWWSKWVIFSLHDAGD